MASSRSDTRRRLLPAALLLILGGCWQSVVGLQAVMEGGFFTAPDGYAFGFSIAAWGWVHLIVGVVAIVVGAGLFGGSATARVLGMVLASASLIANFLWLPIEPWWSFVLMGLDVFVLWAIATGGGRLSVRVEERRV